MSMTQIEAARAGTITPEMEIVANDEHLEIAGDTIRFYRRNGTELDLMYEALGFERAKVRRTTGDDTKDIQAHNIDLYLYNWDE